MTYKHATFVHKEISIKFYNLIKLRHLRKIDLSKNQLSSVDPLAFQNLAQSDVEEVNLSANRLSRMSEGTFVVLKGLKHLQLSDNPWHCDCQLQSFRDYVVHKGLATGPTIWRQVGPQRKGHSKQHQSPQVQQLR